MFNEIEENIEIYEDVIENLCKLYENIGIAEDPVKVYEYFRYMYLNGYLSNTKFSEDIPNEIINLEMEAYIPFDITGSIIMMGYGTSRHTSDFLFHIYNYLNYDSSVLLTYIPNLHNIVFNKTSKPLTNSRAQEYIDDAIKGLDLYSKEEKHFTKKYDGINVEVNYLPPNCIPNHAVNIVKNKEENRIHILDTIHHFICEKIDEEHVKIDDSGFTYTYFVRQDFIQKPYVFNTYYGTNYYKGLYLLNKYDTASSVDITNSMLYEKSCYNYINEYKIFKKNNKEKYQTVTDNFKKMIKRV